MILIGKVTPVVNEKDETEETTESYEEKEQMKEYLEINAKDFLSTLQRLMLMKIDHSDVKISNNKQEFESLEQFVSALGREKIIEKYLKYIDFFKIDITNYDNENEFYPGRVYYIDNIRETIFEKKLS